MLLSASKGTHAVVISILSILSIICIVNVAFPKTNSKHTEMHTDQTSERQMFL